jgi:conjugal transfer ATP-binding protein TraC
MFSQHIDTNFVNQVRGGGYPMFDKAILEKLKIKEKPRTRRQKVFEFFYKSPPPKKILNTNPVIITKENYKTKPLKDQVQFVINLPDEEYTDKLLTSELRNYVVDNEKQYISSLSDYKSHIAPSFREVTRKTINLSGSTWNTYYAQSYPSYIDGLWTRNVLSFYDKRDMSWFIYPEDDGDIQTVLKRRATQLRAEINELASKWVTVDVSLEVEHRDVENIRQKLATKEERYFESSYYTTLYHDNAEKLNEESKKMEQKFGEYAIKVKTATQRMDEWLISTLPYCIDDLGITRSMVTSSLAGSFPFISSDLIQDTGIFYGINLNTGSLVIYDRFSHDLPNANSIVLATSGAGKSFAVKLEIIRYMMLGIPVIVIDPENEYRSLTEKIGGQYINIAINSNQFVNPFDLPPKIQDVEYGKWDLLRGQILNLIGLISILIGWVTPEEEALLDKALQSTYALQEIDLEHDDYTGKRIPLMEDLLHVLESIQWAEHLVIRVSKYVTWTFGKLFDHETNVDMNQMLTVFSIRDLEESLKTPAMYNILNYIWTKVRSEKTKRLLIVDEAWILMQQESSANFMYSIIKRARKYGLGITTISQDVEDFVKSKYGKPIISNSALQLLLKQSTSSIKALDKIFGLSDAEQQKLVSCWIGEWLMFAWSQHVSLKIVASPYEKEFITTDVE